MEKNRYFADLKKNYLFPEVNRRVAAYREKNPQADLISLGIGDTVEPIHPLVAKAISDKAISLGTAEGYQGYGPSYGEMELREQIARRFYKSISADEITISDGAKPDIGRLQLLLGQRKRVLMQDPCYPVYYDTSVMQGHTIKLLPCNEENGFFPELVDLPPFDLLFFCSPNNPTGQAATHAQLEQLVQVVKKNNALLIFDAAYSLYIQDPTLPKSIYEIPGSHEVAVEINSFSKIAGFSGIRLGWTVVPKQLPIYEDWLRVVSTAFNGASILSQKGAIAALSEQGFPEILASIRKTMSNTKTLRNGLSQFPVFGGTHAPYLFVKIGIPSWDGFQHLLENNHLITTPGSGFGSQGEHYLRLTAFAKEEQIEKAAERLQKVKFT